MTDAFDPAFFALGSDTTLTEEQARQITAEATAVAQRSQTFAQAVGNEQRLATRLTKDLAHNRRAMAEYRGDASLVSENTAMRSDFRASLGDKMRSAVCAVVSPRPPSPTSVDGIVLGADNDSNGAEDGANMDADGGGGGGNGGNDDDDDDLLIITGGGGGIGHYPDPLKYIAKRRQELAKRKAAIQSGAGQINATLQRARTANAKDAALKEKMAKDNLLGHKVDQDREVENHRRELEGTKRREAGLAETSRAAHARYLANGMAIAEKVSCVCDVATMQVAAYYIVCGYDVISLFHCHVLNNDQLLNCRILIISHLPSNHHHLLLHIYIHNTECRAYGSEEEESGHGDRSDQHPQCH